MRALLDEAAAAGKPVRIHVEQFNRAMTLYLRLGFTPIAEQGVHILMEWSPRPARPSPGRRPARPARGPASP